MHKNSKPNGHSLPAKQKPRRAARSRSRVEVVVKYLGQATPGRVFDISATGAAIDLAGPFKGTVGSAIAVECTEFGVLRGNIRWLRNGRIGLEFDPSSNAAAQVAAYFRFFHKEVRPVLTR
jgi:hypothetical protein